jgi:hypothetical protein
MAVIKIIRSNEFVNRVRDIKIMVNGQQLGTIGNGQEKEFQVPDGLIVLHGAIDWCSSNKINFTATENDSRVFALGSFAKGRRPNGLAALYYTIFAAARYLQLTALP